jgi:glycosyltransferase involved in cell wall biosynthesis
MLRVLQVCSAEGIGGGEVHVADLAVGLAERGFHVEIAVRPKSGLPELMRTRWPENGGQMAWHRMPFRNAVDLTTVHRLARVIDEGSIDVVHAHVARDYPLAALAVKHAGRGALVLTRHHYLPIKGNVLYRKLLADATVVAVSESVRRTVLESLRPDPERVVTIPNWIDLEPYVTPRDRSAERHALGITRRDAVALVGQLTPLKGQEEFLRAAGLVLERRTDVEFLLVGDDRKPGAPFEVKLRKLADRLGVGDAVRFLGYRPDLPGIFAAVDAVAVPSWNEAFSLVTAEAMAAGRPVVASRAGALEELVEDGVTGLLVPPRDPAALAEAMLRLASDPALVDRLGRAARESAQRFARGPSIDAVAALYERVKRESLRAD